MSGVQKEKILGKVQDKIKEGIENYRAASDAPAKVDVYDVIEEVFAAINPVLKDESKISVDEVSGCLRSAYLDRKDPVEQNHKQMMSKLMERSSLSVLDKPTDGIIEIDSKIKLVGRADRVEDDVVMMFRTAV